MNFRLLSHSATGLHTVFHSLTRLILNVSLCCIYTFNVKCSLCLCFFLFYAINVYVLYECMCVCVFVVAPRAGYG